MSISVCRVCGDKFFSGPLLKYENMPKSAQFLPERDALPHDRGVGLEIWQCSGCGLVQLRDDPVPYYREVIRAAAVSEEMKQFRRKQFSAFMRANSLAGKHVVEIGCGCGEYLSIVQECGMQAYGVEFSETSVARCGENGLVVSRGFVEGNACGLEHGPFAAFLILSYLEHLPHPNLTLGGIRSNLVDGGVGIVEVPNFDMVVRNNLFSEFMTDHLLYFTRETLCTALQLNGFEVVACDEVWHDYIISATVRTRRRLDLSWCGQYRTVLQDELEHYIGQHGTKRVAIWGAGHQALAVIALANLGDKIGYVVDSAPFKQGRYTPATHLRVVSPAALDSEPVDAVIVMAAGYADEVVRILRAKYRDTIGIAVLKNYELEVLQ